MTHPVEDVGRDLADPKAYADAARFEATLAHLRAHAPVCWVEAADYRPFWAITRYSDIMEISRDNAAFTNWPRPILMPAVSDELQAAAGVRTLVHLDDPEHRKMRAISADWFRPKAMRALKERVDQLARIFVDRLADAGGDCDFVQQVAVEYPLYVIMSLLGMPESDFGHMRTLAQELIGSDDDEFQRGATGEDQMPALAEMFAYFQALTASRRAHPTDDLASAISNARVDGELLSDVDVLSYYLIIATAGHDTTSSTISGGLHALIEHPDQHDRLRREPMLMPTAVEEMIRWVTPVREFMRTAARDTTVRGVRIAAGESVMLCYPSANRDEQVFRDGYRFDIGRDPNKHLGFGHGVHFCVGAALARMEVNSFFTELLPRLRSIELSGLPQHIATTFLGGLKHLPIRYDVAG